MYKLLKYRSYHDFPDKDWVVFVHGIGGDSRTYSLQVKDFRHHFNLLLPDLRGHGLSGNMLNETGEKYNLEMIADDMFRLMDELKIKKAHFVGISFGAILIRIMEEMQPTRFLSVVLGGAVLRLRLDIYLIFKLGKFLAPYFNKHFLYKLNAYFIMPRRNHAHARQVFIDIAKTINPKEYIAWLVILEEVKFKLDLLYKLPFAFPTLLIMGDQDHSFLNDGKKFSDAFPETKIKVFEKCGHVCNIERYHDFNSHAIEFFNNQIKLQSSNLSRVQAEMTQ